MKRILPWFFVALFAFEFLFALRPRKEKDFHFREFGEIPVLLNGRIQPFDSVARNSLLQIRSQQEVPLEGNGAQGAWGKWEDLQGPLSERQWWQFQKHPKKLKPTPWLLEVMTRQEEADKRYNFLVHHPELLSLLNLEGKGIENSGLRYVSFNELRPSLEKVFKEEKSMEKLDAQLKTPFQKQITKLYNAVVIYQRLKSSLQPETTKGFSEDLAGFTQSLDAGIAAFKARQAGEKHDEEIFNKLLVYLNDYQFMAGMALPLIVPPLDPAKSRDDWSNIGVALLDSGKNKQLHPAIPFLAQISEAYQKQNVEGFNAAVGKYKDWLQPTFNKEVQKGKKEYWFTTAQPFYRSLLSYLLIFILGCLSWFSWSDTLRRSAFLLTFVALGIHTFGLIMRMVLEGRPPVTNLYSSAIFIGWGAVVLGLVLEKIFKDGIGVTIGASVGVVTQIIAHNLALGSADTMEMMRAVLDTNFWLATHVVVITLGYSSTYVAGALGIIYILRGFFTRSLSQVTAKNISRMIYGIICFATLLSFVGTILGGIWADQSWGRFWGWDPKENGALIIVVWNAVILHARWGGMIRERGLAAMAVFGNVVTTWSYFGVNMLGVGLHSYGFMDEGFRWLVYFGTSQALIILVALIPTRLWASFRQVEKPASTPSKSGPESKPATA